MNAGTLSKLWSGHGALCAVFMNANWEKYKGDANIDGENLSLWSQEVTTRIARSLKMRWRLSLL